MSQEKQVLRRTLRARRLLLSQQPERCEALITNLLTLLSECMKTPQGVLGFYMALPGEVEVTVALTQWAKVHHQRLALPYVDKSNRSMHYRLWREGDPLSPDTAGILAPLGEPVVPQIVLAPCVGYARNPLFRLGNGGGYFDRWLIASREQVSAIGLAFEELAVDPALFEPFDIPMDWVVTECSCLSTHG